MSYRAWARPRVLQHAGRATIVALLAAIFLASAAPAAAWQQPFDSLRKLEPAPTITVEEVPFVRGAFGVLRLKPELAAEKWLTTQAEKAVAAPALGEVIANTALGYVGYPYVAGGAGPGGFDCSGFTQYIVAITTGVWISHAVEAQPWSAGYWVDYGNWLPGDLIFFQNTYRAGISHAAIYIGDGLIVHAENYESGVTIDSIYSSYYGPRYYGAVRIG
jgi:cell wall-associated NlpC family hydrolase